MSHFIWGLALSAIIAGAAYYKQSLSPSGFVAAIILGALIFGLGTWLSWSILILFFISSSLLSKFRSRDKSLVVADFAKTGRRDWLQVLANGAVGLALVILWRLTADAVYCVGYIAAFAAVNADTWATEIGVLSKKPPVNILTLQATAPGASGAVSPLGLTASLAGSAFIALAAALGLSLVDGETGFPLVLAAATLGGFFGSIVDSILGATVQTMYRCSVCGKLTERKLHCAQATRMARGLKCFPNDLVNLLCSLAGSLLAMGMYCYSR
jgi:uncharacterized protein (TIGR00297 family)